VDEQPPPRSLPARLDDLADGAFVSDITDVFNPISKGFGLLCLAGGLAGKGVLQNGLPFFFPVSESPTHLGIPNVSLQLSTPGRALFDVYIPINSDRTLTLALSSDEDNLLVNIDLNALPSCQRNNAPAMSEWILIALLVALLTVGTWSAGRRKGFYESLSLP
jgi:hypothetical protein